MREVRCRVVVGSAKGILFVLGSVVTGVGEMICNRPLVLDEIRGATTALLQCREAGINRLGECRTRMEERNKKVADV